MGAVSPRAKSISSDASNRWRYLATAFLAIALSMLVSCGGGNGGKASDTKSPQQGDAATPTPDARVQAAADEGVLKLEDLPSTWLLDGEGPRPVRAVPDKYTPLQEVSPYQAYYGLRGRHDVHDLPRQIDPGHGLKVKGPPLRREHDPCRVQTLLYRPLGRT